MCFPMGIKPPFSGNIDSESMLEGGGVMPVEAACLQSLTELWAHSPPSCALMSVVCLVPYPPHSSKDLRWTVHATEPIALSSEQFR